jgi:uroporphyrinogen-III synthase
MSGLNQKIVLVTRPDGAEFADLLRKHGAQAVCHPVIRISDPSNWTDVDWIIRELNRFEWLAFASANGVDRFVGRIQQQDSSLANLRRLKLAAIGKQTGQRLVRFGLRASLIPRRNDSLGLSEELIAQPGIRSVLLVRGDRGSSVMTDQLTSAGIPFREVVAYRSINVEQPDEGVTAMLRERQLDWITITSSAIADAAVQLWNEDLRRSKLVSISPTTTAKLNELGFTPSAEAARFNMHGIIEAMKLWPGRTSKSVDSG